MGRIPWMDLWLGLVGASVAVVLWQSARQPDREMPVMNGVWPLVALSFGPFGLLLFQALAVRPGRRSPGARGRRPRSTARRPGVSRPGLAGGGTDPLWMRSARSATHCLAGCALGDLVAMVLFPLSAAAAGGSPLMAEVAVGAVLAFVFGLFVFQALPVMAEKGLPFTRALGMALVADTWSIAAYLGGQIPFFLWLHRAFPGGPMLGAQMFVTMQASMAVGFLTSYPANYELVRRGVKHGM